MDGLLESAKFLSLCAGCTGAFGNQLVYWRGVLKVRDRKINPRMIFVSIFYIVTGGLFGFFVGLQYPTQYIFILGAGAAWPTLLKSMDDIRLLKNAVQEKMGLVSGGDGG